MTAQAYQAEQMSIPWWLVLLEGITSLVIGLFLLTSPGVALVVLVQVMGIFWLIGGIFRIIAIFLDNTLWGLKLFGGLIGIIAGLLVLQHPLWSALLVPTVAIIIIGIEGILFGIISLVLAFQGAGWGVGLLGGLSVLFGLILLGNPFIGPAVLPIVMGAFAVVGGLASIVTAFRVK